METEQSASFAGVGKAVIDKFPSGAWVARELKISQRAVANWVATGVIPEKYRQPLLDLARKHKVDHTAEDYIAYLKPSKKLSIRV